MEYNLLILTDKIPFTFLWLILEIQIPILDSYAELPLKY